MTSFTTDKPINLGQLASELGDANLSASTVDDETTVVLHDDAITEAALRSAVAAHVAIDETGNRTTLETQILSALAANRTYLGLTSPTSAQNTAQVKALTRQMNALIRLAANKFDGTG